jgi:dynein heavy chain 1
MMILVLKSDAPKEQHWKLLMKQLRVNWVLSDLTLGQVWDVNLQKNGAVVTDIILVALGEMAWRSSLGRYAVEYLHLSFSCTLYSPLIIWKLGL